MAVVRKKQDDKYLKMLREIVSIGNNKSCFDCGQRGPTYVNMTIGSFVCTRCSGVLRGLTPPHRVKSISMATFSSDEIEFIKNHGNDECSKTWLGLWDAKRVHTQDQRELMIDKYERKRFFLEPASPLKPLTSVATTTTSTPINGCSILPSQQQQQQQQLYRKNAIKFSSPSKFVQIDKNNNNISRITNKINLNNNNNRNCNSLNITKSGLNIALENNHINNNNNNNHNSQNNNTNKFTPDGDFVADFNNANIFNSTNVIRNQNSNCNNNNYDNINNKYYIKITNGSTTTTTPPTQQQHQQNGIFVKTQNANADFADFEHNPIYNSAGHHSMSLSSTSNSLTSSNGTFNSNTSLNSTMTGAATAAAAIVQTPSADRYAALKVLDEQLRSNGTDTNLDVFIPQINSPTSNNSSSATSINPFKMQSSNHLENSWTTTTNNNNNNNNNNLIDRYHQQSLTKQNNNYIKHNENDNNNNNNGFVMPNGMNCFYNNEQQQLEQQPQHNPQLHPQAMFNNEMMSLPMKRGYVQMSNRPGGASAGLQQSSQQHHHHHNPFMITSNNPFL